MESLFEAQCANYLAHARAMKRAQQAETAEKAEAAARRKEERRLAAIKFFVDSRKAKSPAEPRPRIAAARAAILATRLASGESGRCVTIPIMGGIGRRCADRHGRYVDLAAAKDSLAGRRPIESIHLEIVDCHGGEVSEAVRIRAFLIETGAEIKATVRGWCASAANDLLFAASRRSALWNAHFLVHEAGFGKTDKDAPAVERWTSTTVRKFADQMEGYEEFFARIAAEATGLSVHAVRAMSREENWFGAMKAASLGWVQEVVMQDGTSIRPVAMGARNSLRLNGVVMGAWTREWESHV